MRFGFLVVLLGLAAFSFGTPAAAEEMSGWPDGYEGSSADEVIRRPSAALTGLRRPASRTASHMDLQADVSGAQLVPTAVGAAPAGGDAWVPTTTAGALTQAPRKRWSLTVAAYLWATDISGTSYADGEATDIDVAFSDLFDKLESAFMGYTELRYNRWSFAIDASYVALTANRTGPGGAVGLEAELEQTLVDIRLGYAVLQRAAGSERWGCCCYQRCMTLDAVIGARHWDFEQEIDVAIAGAGIVQREKELDWWDPYVGLRFRWPFASRWVLGVYGDVGGFGIGDASDLTWQIQATLRYQITRGFFVALGYRALTVDRVEGSGATQNGIDATYHGPFLGLGYTF